MQELGQLKIFLCFSLSSSLSCILTGNPDHQTHFKFPYSVPVILRNEGPALVQSKFSISERELDGLSLGNQLWPLMQAHIV